MPYTKFKQYQEARDILSIAIHAQHFIEIFFKIFNFDAFHFVSALYPQALFQVLSNRHLSGSTRNQLLKVYLFFQTKKTLQSSTTNRSQAPASCLWRDMKIHQQHIFIQFYIFIYSCLSSIRINLQSSAFRVYIHRIRNQARSHINLLNQNLVSNSQIYLLNFISLAKFNSFNISLTAQRSLASPTLCHWVLLTTIHSQIFLSFLLRFLRIRRLSLGSSFLCRRGSFFLANWCGTLETDLGTKIYKVDDKQPSQLKIRVRLKEVIHVNFKIEVCCLDLRSGLRSFDLFDIS